MSPNSFRSKIRGRALLDGFEDPFRGYPCNSLHKFPKSGRAREDGKVKSFPY